MSLTAFWRVVQCHWHDLTRQFWPDSPEERTRAEIDRLGADLSRRWRRLVRLRQAIERQRSAGAPEERLARLEDAYQAGCRQIERRKRLRRDLLSGRAQVVDVLHGLPASGDP
jgi:hypothetical protein